MQPRSGAVIPVVIICLVVMAILGVVLVSSATSQYMQTAKVAGELKLREVLLAALEEAHGVAYDRLNRPGAAQAPWAAEVLAALEGADGPHRGVLARHDLKGESLLPRAIAIASAMGCEITSASIELMAFKRLSVDSRGLFEDPRIYYRDADRVLDRAADDAKFEPVREYVGSVRVRVSGRCGSAARTLGAVNDVKLVNVSPVAREFALFSFLSSSRQQDGGPESDDYSRNDLRRGGPIRVFAGAGARIFVRGPFLVDTIGFPGGDGGTSPPASPSYWPIVGNEWWGWAQVPATHDGVLVRSGPTLVNFGMPPMRPNGSGDWRLFKGLVTQRFGSAWADLFHDDPGYYILDGQRWYAESTSSAASDFSIWGDPAGGRMRPFRGVLSVYDDSGRHPQGPSDALTAGDSLARPSDEDRRWVIEPEGGLHGVYTMVEYSGSSYAKGLYEKYSIASRGQVIGRLGLHWEKRYETSWLHQFVIDLVQGGTVFGTLGTELAILIPRQVAEALAVTLASWVGVDLSEGNRLTDLNGITPDNLVNAFPPGYRPPARAVTRRYPRLADLVARQRQQPLLLDGVIAFDELSCDRPFAYRGRGVFYSEQTQAPTLAAPIAPATDNDPTSYLTLHHEGPVRQAHRGGAMLTLRPSSPGQAVVASVYATQGVKPAGPLAIAGNLTCGYVNKSQIPDGAALDLYYRSPPDAALCRICAVSPRAALVVDR